MINPRLACYRNLQGAHIDLETQFIETVKIPSRSVLLVVR